MLSLIKSFKVDYISKSGNIIVFIYIDSDKCKYSLGMIFKFNYFINLIICLIIGKKSIKTNKVHNLVVVMLVLSYNKKINNN